MGVQRQYHDWSAGHARPAKTSAFHVCVASNEQQAASFTFETRFISTKTGQDIRDIIRSDYKYSTYNINTENKPY
jgi:beta-mannosidase